jgi:NADH-quinone oxidoreductase subunit J
MIFLTLSATFILWAKNPMHAVLGLILIFINSATVLLSIQVPFLALVYVVVYVGAICVLFLFVIMLLNLRSTELANRNTYKNELLPYFLSYLVFVLSYCYILITSMISGVTDTNIDNYTTILPVTSFITDYIFKNPMHFVLLTILLFLAIVSPITMFL